MYSAALLLAGCFFVTACGNTDAEIEALTAPKEPVEEALELESFLSQEGRVQAKLTAPVMLRYPARDTPFYEFPKTLHVDFYNDSLVKESKLDALYGKYNQGQKMVYLRDSVVVINMTKGDTLYCDDLWWNQNTQMIYTHTKVRIRTKTEIIDGMGMNARQNFTAWNILDGQGSIEFRDEEFGGDPMPADTTKRITDPPRGNSDTTTADPR